MKPQSIDNKSTVKETIYSVIIVTFASILIGFTISAFLNPLNLYAGGVTGFVQIILKSIGLIFFSNAHELDYLLAALNFLLLLPFDILAYFKLSKKYGIYSLWSSIVQSIVILFQKEIASLNVFGVMTDSPDTLACVFMVGLLGGFSNGLIFRRGGTSGGFVILCQYLNIKKNKSVGSFNLIISSLILFFGALISFFDSSSNGGISVALSTASYTLLTFVISSIVIDSVHTAYNKIKLEVITDKGNLIVDALLKHLPHGITVTRGYGAYTKTEKEVLNILIHSYEINKYINIIKNIDESAFILSVPVSSFSGRFKVQIINK